MTRLSDQGVSLLSVLVVVAIGAGLLRVMLASEEQALSDAQEAADRARAIKLAEGGVTSVAVALQRDFEAARHEDHMQEPWATSVQQAIKLDFGVYEVTVEDARGRFDVNALDPRALGEVRVFTALLRALDLPEVLSRQIAQAVPLKQVSALKKVMSRGDFERLEPHIVALPERSKINLNAATETVLTVLFQSSGAARSLAARRNAKGYLEPSDLAALGLVVPPTAGFTSQAFDVRSSAQVGDARRIVSHRLLRDPEIGTIRSIPLVDRDQR